MVIMKCVEEKHWLIRNKPFGVTTGQLSDDECSASISDTDEVFVYHQQGIQGTACHHHRLLNGSSRRQLINI